MSATNRKFFVRCPDLGEDPEEYHLIYAIDAEQAACEWADLEDVESADYWIVGGETATVVVRDPSNGEEQIFHVNGEPSRVYTATKVAKGGE